MPHQPQAKDLAVQSVTQGLQCLVDLKGLKRLLDMTQAAMSAGVEHTPTFIVNGKMIDAATWEGLEPELKSALGERG